MTMDRLEHIKTSVAMEYGHETFEDLLWSMADGEGSDGLKWFENVLAEIAHRYAAERVGQAMREYAEFKARKPLGIQEARILVSQMLGDEISFSRFVELINEGDKQ